VVRRGVEHQSIPHLDVSSTGTACRHLDRRERTPGSRDTPGRHGGLDLQYTPVASRKDEIDGKVHRERVDEVARRDNQGRTGWQAVPPEQSFLSRRRIEGAFKRGRDRLGASLDSEDKRPRAPLEQRLQEMWAPAHEASLVSTGPY